MTADPTVMTGTFAPPSSPPLRRAYMNLFVISFGLLFFELACIRWFSSTVVFMTFFTNFVLMACFLGMTVGCLTASRKQNFINVVIPLALLTVTLAYGVLWAYPNSVGL